MQADKANNDYLSLKLKIEKILMKSILIKVFVQLNYKTCMLLFLFVKLCRKLVGI